MDISFKIPEQVSGSSLNARISEDMSNIVRSVLASSRLRTNPTRLELRMVCQEVVAETQSYFAKLEASVPSKLSFEQGGGGPSASETLQGRLADLGMVERGGNPGRSPPPSFLRRSASPTGQVRRLGRGRAVRDS